MAEEYQMPKGELMRGKRGIVTGVANHQSIAWGIASQLAAQGAEIAFLHLPGMERRVQPLADSIGVKVLAPVDVTDDASMDAGFAAVEKAFGTIDFFVHAIAFAPRDQISGSFVENASRAGFLQAMEISVYSFADCCRRAGRGTIGDWEFSLAFAMFRLAAIAQGIMGRVVAGTANDPNAQERGRRARPLADSAWALISSRA